MLPLSVTNTNSGLPFWCSSNTRTFIVSQDITLAPGNGNRIGKFTNTDNLPGNLTLAIRVTKTRPQEAYRPQGSLFVGRGRGSPCPVWGRGRCTPVLLEERGTSILSRDNLWLQVLLGYSPTSWLQAWLRYPQEMTRCQRPGTRD